MLSIGKLGIGQERYYLDKVAEGAEDYYSGEGEAPGEWIGDAAARLGLDGDDLAVVPGGSGGERSPPQQVHQAPRIEPALIALAKGAGGEPVECKPVEARGEFVAA